MILFSKYCRLSSFAWGCSEQTVRKFVTREGTEQTAYSTLFTHERHSLPEIRLSLFVLQSVNILDCICQLRFNFVAINSVGGLF